MPTPKAAQEQLEQQLAQLLTRAGKIEDTLRQNHDRDWTEQAIEVENDQVLEGLDEMTLAEVKQIRAALTSIANNTYGTCVTCGGAIGDARLAAIPSALVCVACAGGARRPA